MSGTQVNINELKGDINNIESPELKVDSIINKIISDISQVNVKIDIRDRSFPSQVIKKIEHNQLKNKRSIIQQYKVYSSHIESAYNIAEKNIINGKQSAMLILNDMYIKSLNKFNIDYYSPDMELIHNNADNIIDDVIKQLNKFLYSSANVSFSKEQMLIGINVVVAHAFVECYVLENPNDSN
ncbi:hypothetical protein I6F48_00240 [Pseudoalteromonas sp. SWYJ118]|uniref:ABC-three component system protein n=1 Tax=Pseudoalteromonas sp. SWYJ118 TaxID=2792062 RepID=UPI0018CD2A29|nr:ABC-three component system protein [Pseudoalteromonas sp. SWYJ118]MBH0073992.1 hypothetical protein [Pseudoalteromonas sp. SWYJ118]